MRYLLPIIALLLFFTSCKKKRQKRNCYLCTQTDSIKSNIPKLEKPVYSGITELCDITEDQKNVQVKIRTKSDTTYNSNDTVVVHTTKFECEFDFEQQNTGTPWEFQLRPKK